jgi:hypothetical protein
MGSQAAFARLATEVAPGGCRSSRGPTRVSLPRFFNPAEGVLITDKGVYRSHDGGPTSGGRAGTRSYSRAREHVRPSMPSAPGHIASDAPAWQVLVAVALAAAPPGGLAWVASRIHASSVLTLGARIPPRCAWLKASRGAAA